MISEFDIHQLKLMKNRILNFEENKADLGALLSITRSLEEFLNSLKTIDEQLKENLTAEWWELELISSVMMDREIDIISAESKQEISLVLENMKKMIETVVDKK